MAYKNNSIYSGQINEVNQPHGLGRLITSKAIYEGQFRDGKTDDWGRSVLKNKCSFAGWRKDGKKHGYGISVTFGQINFEGLYDNNEQKQENEVTYDLTKKFAKEFYMKNYIMAHKKEVIRILTYEEKQRQMQKEINNLFGSSIDSN